MPSNGTIVTRDVILDRARQLVDERLDELAGHGAGERLRRFLEVEFGKKAALRDITTQTLAGLVASKSNPHIVSRTPPTAAALALWEAPRAPSPEAGHGSPREIRQALDCVLWLQEHGYISGRLMSEVTNEILQSRVVGEVVSATGKEATHDDE